MTTELLTERQGSTLIMCLSGPATRNALVNQVFAAGIEILNMAESNPDVHAIVLTGAGEHFCSGVDLQHFHHPKQNLVTQGAQIDSFHQWIEAIRSFPKPVIAAVEGVATGGGLALALACDLVVASETARFGAHPGTPLSPDGGLSLALVHLIGRNRALQLLWQCQPIGSTQAKEWGLIQHLCATGHARQQAIEYAEQLSQLPRTLTASIKELVNDAANATWKAQMNAEKQHVLIHLAQGQIPGQIVD